jgi:hypothetical protein
MSTRVELFKELCDLPRAASFVAAWNAGSGNITP